jgi:uridine phosphorylase
MSQDRPIIHPVKGKNAPDPGRMAVLVSTAADLNLLCRTLAADPHVSRRLFTSRLHVFSEPSRQTFSLVGPVVGAPYAVMLLETLIAWGAQRFIYIGWCGAIAPGVKAGDIVLPVAAAIDEGTSRHYSQEPSGYSHPATPAADEIRNAFLVAGQPFHEGPVWTTDAIFMETPGKVRHYQQEGALAVDMELSALFTVGRVRGVEVGGILVVSDELSTLTWRPGFKDEHFEKGRIAACEAVKQICQRK